MASIRKQRKKTTTYRPPDGVTAGKAEKLAKAYAATWEDKIKGYAALDENRTLSELAEWYYRTVAPSVLKPKTLQNYQKTISDHVLPTLGREKLKNITPPMLDSLFTDLQENGCMETHYRLIDKALFDSITRQALADKAGVSRAAIYDCLEGQTIRKENAEKIAAALDLPLKKVFEDKTEKKGLSGASVNKIKLNLSAIFTAAVKKEIMRRNPCKLATPPKVDTKQAEFMTEDECHILLDYLSRQPDFQFEVIINMLLATGMRCGELCALHWEDINLETGLVYIKHTLVSLNGEYTRTEPKTSGSVRYVVLPGYIIELLKRHKQEQHKALFRAGGSWKAKDAVFTNRSGNYLLSGTLNKWLHKACAACGLSGTIHVHTLRHTYTSLLINNDITAKVIADRLGHSTVKITLDEYSHVFKESRVKAMQAIDMSLFKGKAAEE